MSALQRQNAIDRVRKHRRSHEASYSQSAIARVSRGAVPNPPFLRKDLDAGEHGRQPDIGRKENLREHAARLDRAMDDGVRDRAIVRDCAGLGLPVRLQRRRSHKRIVALANRACVRRPYQRFEIGPARENVQRQVRIAATADQVVETQQSERVRVPRRHRCAWPAPTKYERRPPAATSATPRWPGPNCCCARQSTQKPQRWLSAISCSDGPVWQAQPEERGGEQSARIRGCPVRLGEA